MAIMQVPVVKGKGTIEIDTSSIPDDVYQEIVLQGLKVLVNRGTSKITKETYDNPEELKAAAMAKAEEQVELIKTSSIKFTGAAKAKKASGVVMTEARRLAKALVKDELKRLGYKISAVPAKDITKAANDYLAQPEGAELIAKAGATIAERASAPKLTIDLKALIHESPELMAKSRKRGKTGDGQLSAKQAGKVQTRTRETHATS